MIEDSSFKSLVNDAIDASGSRIVIRWVTIAKAGDKAISVGEGSFVDADGLMIEGSNIGVAVKDGSVFKGENRTIKKSGVGIAVFRINRNMTVH